MGLANDIVLYDLLYSAVQENDKTKRNLNIQFAKSVAQFLPDDVIEDVKKMVRDKLKETTNG